MSDSNKLTVVDFNQTALDTKGDEYAKLDYEFFKNFESVHTQISYRNDIKQFFKFIFNFFPYVNKLHKIERAHIVAFRNWLFEAEMAPKTINRKLAAFSSYCDFLVEKDLIPFNPCTSVKRPRQEVRKPTNDLTDEQVIKLFEVVENNKRAGKLHKAVLYTLFTTGIRKSELINLKLKDIRKRDAHIVIEIKAKGGKFLTKVLHPLCVQAIEEYVMWMETKGRIIHPEDWLFQPTQNPSDPKNLCRPLDPKAVDYILQSNAKKAGIYQRISPHSARATYIGSALEAGKDLWKIAQDVGHSSVQTTARNQQRSHKRHEAPEEDRGGMTKKGRDGTHVPGHWQ